MRDKCCYSLLVSIFAFFSCISNNEKEARQGISIPLQNLTADTIFLSDWMTPDEVIPLETTDESLLASVDKLIEFDNQYFVLDKVRKTVLVFDNEGKFVKRIGKIGDAPNEYLNLHDFTLDRNVGCIYLLTNNSEVYVYDVNGSFLRKAQISNSLLWSIECYGGNIYCSSNHLTYTSGDNAFLFYTFNSTLQELNKQVNVHTEQIYTPLLISLPFQIWNENLYYIDNYFNMIYGFQNNDAVPVYSVSFESPMPTDYFQDVNLFMQNQSEYDFIIESFFTEDYLVIAYIHKGEHYTSVISLSENRIIANGRTKGILPKVFVNKGLLLSPISAEVYLSYLTHLDKYMDKSISYEDNHLILKWKFTQQN